MTYEDEQRPWLIGTTGEERRAAAAAERARTRTSRAPGAVAYRAPSDRPSHRRSGEDGRSAPRVSTRIRDLVIRESDDGGSLVFDGYGSVTDTGYEMWDWYGPYVEQVSGGAFAESLARPDLDTPLVLQHADLRRIARTTNGSLQLAEDDHGLHVLAPQLDPADQDVAYIVPKLRSGLVDEMSFKFMITAGQWSPDWEEYHIKGADIHRGDVAIVGYGANPYTAGSGLRSRTPEGSAAEELARRVRGMSTAELVDLISTRNGIVSLIESQRATGRGPTPSVIITDDEVRQRTLD